MDLRQMVADQLDLNLARVAAEGSGLENVAFSLIEHAVAHGKLAELVIAARNQNPGNPRLDRFAASLSLSSAASVALPTLEKVVSRNATFLDVQKWRLGLLHSEWRVCRVDHDGAGVGTGFLVAPDLVLTCHHVVQPLLAAPSRAAHWSCRFDHKLSASGDSVVTGISVRLAGDWLVDSSPHSAIDLQPDPKLGDPSDDELDFALLRLAERVGDRPVGKGDQAEPRGWVTMSAEMLDYATKQVIAILQHPDCRPMQLALALDQVVQVNKAMNRIRYTVPTEGGSSGAPVFDGDWNLIALHHSGDPATVNPTFNEAIPIAKIAARPKVAAALKR